MFIAKFSVRRCMPWNVTAFNIYQTPIPGKSAAYNGTSTQIVPRPCLYCGVDKENIGVAAGVALDIGWASE